jgi:hypothetical protein
VIGLNRWRVFRTSTSRLSSGSWHPLGFELESGLWVRVIIRVMIRVRVRVKVRVRVRIRVGTSVG